MNGVPVVLAFLLGSIPFGIFFARSSGIDIRQTGSNNIGATNVGRVVGRQAGILTLACDLAKGALPVILANLMEIPQEWIASVCLAAVLGHVYSPWLRFRGGKGVATAAGTFLIAAPMATIICLVIFALVLKLSKRVSVGSLFSIITLPFILHTTGAIGQMTAAGTIVAVVVIIKHTENIKRLLAKNEPKITS